MANSAHIDSILELRRSESYCSRACRRGQAQFKERKACVAPAASTRKCSSLLVKSHEHPAWGTRHHRCTTYGIYDFARFVQTFERARVIQASWRRASSPLWAFGFFWWWS